MVTRDSDSTPADPTIDAASGRPPDALASAGGQGRLVGVALVAGLLAGVAAWLVGATILESYRDALTPKVTREVDAELVRRFARARLTSAVGTFTALGGIVGLSLGMAGGLARRSASAGAKAAIVGCVVGSIAGLSISLLVLPNFYKAHDPQSHDLMLPLLTLGSICSSVGAAGGLAFGIGIGGRGRWMKSLLGWPGRGSPAAAGRLRDRRRAIAFPAGQDGTPDLPNPCDLGAMFHVLGRGIGGRSRSALGLSLSSKKLERRSAPVDEAGYRHGRTRRAISTRSARGSVIGRSPINSYRR